MTTKTPRVRANVGKGPTLMPIDIGHPEYSCLIEPDTAFWALVRKEKLVDALSSQKFLKALERKASAFMKEMDILRFSQKPSAVYFNPTERCNLNCPYCYIPEKMRKNGRHMTEDSLIEALGILKRHFTTTLPKGTLPQVIFHGAEPLLNRKAVFAGMEMYERDFLFGIQTNAAMLDDEAIKFLTERGVSIGLSLDSATPLVADRTRKGWKGESVFGNVVDAMERLRGYPNWSVICTITTGNVRHLTSVVEFFHEMEAPSCMLNVVRCTLKPSRRTRPSDEEASRHYIKALDRTHELFMETGRKMPVANFANILLSILAPTARRLMCDISPCGGGRCFFAVAPGGEMFPCSEFIGLDKFKGGNIFKDDIGAALKSKAFGLVTTRKVEDVEYCADCAIRHFCGSPCPAEAHEMNGSMKKRGAFCEFYEEQARYAFRLIADGKAEAYLWDGWKEGTRTAFSGAAACI
jgi:uncharacterized protein